MTEHEMLELILQKITGLEDKVTGLEDKVTGLEDKVTGLENKETGLEETPSRRQDWIMGITIFFIQSIQIADVVGELLWFGLNGNGYM